MLLDNLFEIKEQIGTQKIIQLSNLKMIFGVSENNNNEKIFFIFSWFEFNSFCCCIKCSL